MGAMTSSQCREERRRKKERRKRSRRKAIGFDPETLEDDLTELSRAGKFSGLSVASLSGYGIFSGLNGENVWLSLRFPQKVEFWRKAKANIAGRNDP